MVAWTVEQLDATHQREAAEVTDAQLVRQYGPESEWGNQIVDLCDPWSGASERDRAFGLAERGVVESLIEYARKNYDPEFPLIGPPKKKSGQTFKRKRYDPDALVMRWACADVHRINSLWAERYGTKHRVKRGEFDSITRKRSPGQVIGPTATEISAAVWGVDPEALKNRMHKSPKKKFPRRRG